MVVTQNIENSNWNCPSMYRRHIKPVSEHAGARREKCKNLCPHNSSRLHDITAFNENNIHIYIFRNRLNSETVLRSSKLHEIGSKSLKSGVHSHLDCASKQRRPIQRPKREFVQVIKVRMIQRISG